ncbi:ABC transporter permease, partial [Pseudomonas syringae]
IDLSVGSTLALVGALAAMALNAWHLPWPLVLLGGLAVGAMIGALNGYFIAYAGIPAFIVTLATLTIIRGLAMLLTQGYSIPVPREEAAFLALGRGWFLGVPLTAWLALLVTLGGVLVLGKMRFGRYLTGIGANAESVRRAGVNHRGVLLRVYMLSGMAAALAGMIVTARLGSGSSNQGEGFELEVIAAVVLGSTSLFGGFGTIVGTLLGVLTMAAIKNGLILAHVSPFYTQIATGLIVLLAIWLNTRILRTGRPLGRAGA